MPRGSRQGPKSKADISTGEPSPNTTSSAERPPDPTPSPEVFTCRVEVVMGLAAWRALLKFRYVTPSQLTVLQRATIDRDGDCVSFEIGDVDARFLAGDLTHEIVRGRRSERAAELMNEAAVALETALGEH